MGKEQTPVRSAPWLMGRPRPRCCRRAGQSPLCSDPWWLLPGQKALAVKEQWKELKATYQEHVEAITGALTQALAKTEEAQSKRVQLQEALEQLQAKVQPG